MADLKISVDYSELISAAKTTDQTKQAVQLLGQQFARTGDQSAYMRAINQIVAGQKNLATNARMSKSQIMQLAYQYKQATVFTDRLAQAQNQLNIATQASARGINRAGVLTQQAGYQIGDFIVQVQSGTNAFVAFGQQATQVAGTLTLLGGKWILIGSVLGIAIPLMTALAAAMMRTKEATDSASKSAKHYEDAIKSLDSSVQDFLTTKEAMAKGLTKEEYLSLGSLNTAQKEVDEARKKLEELKEIAAGGIKPRTMSMKEFFELTPNIAAQEAALAAATERYNIIKEMTDEKRAELSKELGRELQLQREINTFGENSAQVASLKLSFQEEDLEAQAKKLGFSKDEIPLLKDQLRQAALIVQEREKAAKVEAGFLKDTEAAGDEMVKAFNAAQDLTKEIGQGAVDALTLAGVDITSGVDAAAKAAARLADNLNVSLGHAINIMTLGEEVKGRMVRSGVSTGAIPPEALADLPDPAADGYEDLMAGRRKRAAQREREAERERERAANSGAGGADPLAKLQEQIRLEQELLGKTEAQQRVIRALGIDWKKYGQTTVDSLVASIEEMDRFNEKVAEQQRLADFIGDSFGDAFLSVIDGTKSAKDAFRSMAADIIKELYRVLVVQRMVGAISNALGSGGSAGGFLANLLRRESGGPMMPNQPYIVGERGPELVIPGRSATVTNADLTRKSMGGESINIVNNINVSGGTDPAAIRMEVAKLMPQITNATKTAVIDARRRGGQMRAAFQ